MTLSSGISPSQSTPQLCRHAGDPRDKMRIPRKPDLPSLPQDPAVRSSIVPILAPPTHLNFTIQPNSPHQHVLQAMLPSGLVLPPGIDPAILLSSDHALTLLKQLPPSQQQAALLEFEDAMRNKGNRVRNSQAYLVGVIKRYITVTRKDKGVGVPRMGNSLTPVVKVTLQKMVDSGFCTPKDVGEKVIAKMKMLSERDAILAIDEIAGVNRDKIRNFSSYFMGILNRYMRGEETPHQHRSPQAVSSGSPSHNTEPNKRLNDRHGRRSHRDDDDCYHRSPSDRRRRSHSSDSEYKTSRRRRGKHRDRGASDDASYASSSRDCRRSRRDRSRSRSRSRDRYDERRDRDRHDRVRRYRSRSHSSSRSRSPEYKRDRHRSSYRSSRRSDKSDHRRLSDGFNEKSMKQMPLQIPATMAVPFPGSSIPPPPPPPPPPPRNHLLPPGVFSGWQNLPPNPSVVTHRFVPQVQHTHVFPPNQVNLSNHAPNFSHPQQSGGLQSSTQYGTPTGVPMSSTDILGIAEKAASAVQALTNARNISNMSGQQNHPAQMLNPVSQPPNHTQTRIHSNSSTNGSNAITTNLDPMVQLALKNLHATGHLDKEPGSNTCRLLQKIPGPVALQCLEKFSSCDVSIMRSKEGYLIGILRKAANGHQ